MLLVFLLWCCDSQGELFSVLMASVSLYLSGYYGGLFLAVLTLALGSMHHRELLNGISSKL